MSRVRTPVKLAITFVICVIVLFLGIGLGSVTIPPREMLAIFANKLFGAALPGSVEATHVSILWSIRLPRALLGFIVGGALAVSGTVMQSVLKNPLASSFTLGISSGASLGAALVMVTGFTIPLIGLFTLPLTGLVFGLVTVFLAVTFASRLDKDMGNHTIILVGMVFSLFINALLTLVAALSTQYRQQIMLWQMGSFSLKDWSNVAVLLPIVVIGVLILTRYARELDLLTFGEEQARVVGVDVTKVKWILLGISAALTGSAIAFVGVIGFIDLIAPHVVRRLFGSAHRLVIPVSALFGGCFMVIADLLARTVVSPSELAVGAITAIIGAPFFAYVYFGKRKR